jgi:uncharacterized UBP type Zn finger protein
VLLQTQSFLIHKTKGNPEYTGYNAFEYLYFILVFIRRITFFKEDIHALFRFSDAYLRNCKCQYSQNLRPLQLFIRSGYKVSSPYKNFGYNAFEYLYFILVFIRRITFFKEDIHALFRFHCVSTNTTITHP